MKKAVLFLFIAFAATAHSQNLNDLLFSGKLKSDSGSVVRKTDDLKSKIDTSAKKKPMEQPKSIATKTTADSPANKTNSTATNTLSQQTDASIQTDGTTTVNTQNAAPTKSNNKIWKEYTDGIIANMKDVISSKKVKKDSYFFMVEYEISAEGVTTINNVTISPDNAFLLEQVKQRMQDAPQLNPALDSNSKPQKVKRRYNFYITKD